jgi:hypothetical protein
MPTVRDLIRAAASKDCCVVRESAGRWDVYQVEAPAGSLLNGDVSAFRVEWLKGDLAYRDQAIADAIERLATAELVPVDPADA